MGTATREASGHAHTVRHFGRLARSYDRRYRRYNQMTLRRALEALTLSGDARVLDVGCGTGEFERLVRERYPRARLVGIDVTPHMLDVAREKFRDVPDVTFLRVEAEALPFGPASFDAVVSCNMLHHVRAISVALREWARVLRPRGQLVIVDWSRDAWHCRVAHYWLRLVKRSYVAMYRARELCELVAGSGLAVEGVSRFFVPPYFAMMRIVARRQQVSCHG